MNMYYTPTTEEHRRALRDMAEREIKHYTARRKLIQFDKQVQTYYDEKIKEYNQILQDNS
jgi:hypothetical protein